MNTFDFAFAGSKLSALGSGALWWPSERLLCVSDLHLGKSERIARRLGTMVPPYETQDTLARLQSDIAATGADTVVCLGDSFDDIAAADSLREEDALWITRMQAGRRWIWIEGNHDPGPVSLGGTHLAEFSVGPLVFRHIAESGAVGEISGHYHPKVRVKTRARRISRPAFLVDEQRIILPAYGTYTGGLHCTDPVLAELMSEKAFAVVTGPKPMPVPLPR